MRERVSPSLYLVTLAAAALLLAGCGLVESPQNGGDAPPIDADPADVRAYRDQVQPILDDTVRDVAKVANVDVKIEGGNVSVGVDRDAAATAEREAQQGLEELRAVDPPPGLERTHDELVASYEEGVPALRDFVAAVQSGEAGRISRSAREDLPRIQRMLSEIQDVQRQLGRAGGQ